MSYFKIPLFPKFPFFVLVLCFLVPGIAPGFAKEAESNDVYNEEIFIERSEYVRPTVENLAKLYWKMAALDLRNPVFLDNYLRITECGIFSRFYNNDFEWQRIRDATRQALRLQVEDFSSKFRFKTKIQLQRYDFQKQEFPLHEEDSFIGVRRLQISNNNRSEEICFNSGRLEGFPRNAIMNVEKPLTLDAIYVPQQTAQKFIDSSVERFEGYDNRDQLLFYFRPVYITFYVSVNAFSRMYYDQQRHYNAEVIGTVDRIEIYSDIEDRNLLWAKNFTESDKKAQMAD